MSRYTIKIGVDRTNFEDGISYDERDELLTEFSQLVDGDSETEYPSKHLSAPTTEIVLIVGTVVLSNLNQFVFLYKNLIEMPDFFVEAVGAKMNNTIIFEAPNEVKIDVDVDILCKKENTVLYRAEEKPELLKQRERERFLENVNKIQPEEEEFESYEEFEKEYQNEE